MIQFAGREIFQQQRRRWREQRFFDNADRVRCFITSTFCGRRSWLIAEPKQTLPAVVRSRGRRWTGTLFCQFAMLFATWSGTAWADRVDRLFVEIEDPERLGRIIEYNAAGVARSASYARRYRIVEVDTALLMSDKPFYLNLFEDVSLLVETIEWSVGVNEFHRRWRGRILDFGQSRQHVEMLRQGLSEQKLPPGIAAGMLEQTFLEITASSSSFDVDAETGLANLSGQRRYGRVTPEDPSGSVVSPQAPWKLMHEAFRSVSIPMVSVPMSGEIVTYAVNPLPWSPRYAMIVEVDPDRVTRNIANPAERKARIEESLRFERSLPSEEGKVTIGEIE